MLKVLVKGDDLFYLWGIKHYLAQLFFHEYGCRLNFLLNFTSDNISQADIIIIPLCKGEHYLCMPELHSRNKGVVIGIIEDSLTQKAGDMKCIENIVFIERKEALYRVREKVVMLWEMYLANKGEKYIRSCTSCSRKKLSHKQMQIMEGICQGRSTPEIARTLRLSEKTVFAHKYLVMNKFNLRTNYDLIIFFRRLAELNHYSPTRPECFR